MRHIHLDLVGGLSGDMFISAVLDTFPGLGENLEEIIALAGFPELVTLSRFEHNDGTLTGTRFTVEAKTEESHHHRHYSEIRRRLADSELSEATKSAAQKMFLLIAEVEAAIHGKSVESVAFHEVGAWDSIADIVLAAHLVTELDASWSVGAVPMGRGFVETAHGRLPVPAPATAMLLEGFQAVDDGIEGERVTPTGAAILRYLEPADRLPGGYSLKTSGFGFGAKQFPGISNTVRMAVFEQTTESTKWEQDQVSLLRFEIDDMTPEVLAESLEKLRGSSGVIDVVQQPVYGKKQRQGWTVSVLAGISDTDSVTERCFALTSTLGIRRELVERAILKREEIVVHVNEHRYRVKVAHRPGGLTAKVEMDDLAKSGLVPAEQEQVRIEAEKLALQQVRD